MKQLNFIFTFLCIVSFFKAEAQDDIKQLEDLANSISIGVNTKKPELILDAFIHPSALIYSTYKGLSTGGYAEETNTAQGLSDFIKNSDKEITQRFEFVKAEKISEGRAIVKTYYYVTIDGQKSHKGDEFYLAIKTSKGWKFISLMFTLEVWRG